MPRKIFLDTNALMCLGGIQNPDLRNLQTLMKAKSLELGITHIQVDESTKHIKFHEKIKEKHEKKVEDYQQKVNKALESLKDKGIIVRLEDTKITVTGVSRSGYTVVGGEEIGKLYDELRKEIDVCEKARERIKPVLNIACDAAIAVSSLRDDFFITCDRCLFDSWSKIMREHKGQFRFPKVVFCKPSTRYVVTCVLDLLKEN